MFEYTSEFIGAACNVSIGMEVLIKADCGGWIIGKCLCLTEKVCVVEITAIRPLKPTPHQVQKSSNLNIESISESNVWPPSLPKGFPLTASGRGYYARIAGATKWVCGRQSPKHAYALYLHLRAKVSTNSCYPLISIGEHVAFPWSVVFVPAIAPRSFIPSLIEKRISQYSFSPTTDAPVAIRGVPELKSAMEFPCRGWAVYFLCFKGHVVYVGQSRQLGIRLNNHADDKIFDAVFYLSLPTESQAGTTERKFIRNLKPVYNRSHNGEASSDPGEHFVRCNEVISALKNSIASSPSSPLPAGRAS